MKRIIVVALPVFLLSLVAQGRTPVAGPSDGEEEINELEGRRLQAMIQADTAALEGFLADDLTYTHSTGQTDTKVSFLEALKSGTLKYNSILTRDVKVRLYGSAAVVTGRAQVEVEAQQQKLGVAIRFTDVYAKKDGRWQMVAWQSTRSAQP